VRWPWLLGGFASSLRLVAQQVHFNPAIEEMCEVIGCDQTTKSEPLPPQEQQLERRMAKHGTLTLTAQYERPLSLIETHTHRHFHNALRRKVIPAVSGQKRCSPRQQPQVEKLTEFPVNVH